MDTAQLIPLLTALGAGTAIGNYVGSGRARREVRGAVLQALASAENARWVIESRDHRLFRSAVRDLETSSLIARIPRPAVRQYVLLAEAAWRYSKADFDDKGGDEDMFAGSVDTDLTNVVQDFAEVITQLAWRPWWSRLKYRSQLNRLCSDAASIDRGRVKLALAEAQFALGRHPGLLGDIYDLHYPKSPDT